MPLLGSPSSTLLAFFFLASLIPLLKPNNDKKGTLIIQRLLGNLVYLSVDLCFFFIPVYLPMHLSLTHLTYRIHLICRIYRTLLCLLPSYPILSYPILSYPILSYPILSYPILSYPILSYPILSYPILSYPIPSLSRLSLYTSYVEYSLCPSYLCDLSYLNTCIILVILPYGASI